MYMYILCEIIMLGSRVRFTVNGVTFSYVTATRIIGQQKHGAGYVVFEVTHLPEVQDR